jgi:hypothetical protein
VNFFSSRSRGIFNKLQVKVSQLASRLILSQARVHHINIMNKNNNNTKEVKSNAHHILLIDSCSKYCRNPETKYTLHLVQRVERVERVW